MAKVSRPSTGDFPRDLSAPTTYSAGETLYEHLSDHVVKCGARINDYTSSSFLPVNVIDATATREAVKAKSSWTTSFYHSYIGRVAAEAQKLFVILGLCEQEQVIFAIYDLGLRDEHLPLTKGKDAHRRTVLVSPQNEVFDLQKILKNTKLKASEVDTFLEKQWLVLAPVVQKLGEHIQVEGNIPLPFYDIKAQVSSGASNIYKGKLHPAHIVSVQSRCL
jgi:hypothetical protein